jgi:hypothetical protein
MHVTQVVPRHRMVSSCLLLAMSACAGGGGAQKMAMPASAAYGGGYNGGGGGYQAPSPVTPAHASISTGNEGPSAIAETAPERPGLGTTFGESVYAPISFAPFVRSAPDPWAEVLLHYNDESGVRAHAEYLNAYPRPLEVPAGDGSLSVALVDETGRTLPGYAAGGRSLVIGDDGERYKIVVRNATTARFEIVASVDGLDVIDGKPADPNRRGYLVDPHDVLVIDGFRTSDANVAAFRFGRVADSYAAQTTGDRNVGVVGLAIFSEQGAVWTPVEIERRDTANAFPSRGYAMPPR